MALQVWLPLNGDLHNQGLSNVSVTNYSATVDNSGKIGKCYSFTINQYIEVTGIPFSSLTMCTVCFWIKIPIDDGNWLPFTGQSTSYYILATSSGTGAFYHQNAGSGTIYCDGVARTSPINDGNWHHYCITGINLSSWTRFLINNYGGTGGTWNWNGKLNDVRIYDTALSPKEIHEISKGLVLHYPLNDMYSESTTNLASTSASGWNNSGTCTRNYNDTSIPNPPTAGNVYSVTATSDGSMAMTCGTTSSNLPSKTIVASVYCWLDGTQDGSVIYLRSTKTDGSVGYLYYNGNSNPTTWPTRQWIRLVSNAITTASDATTFYICTYLNKNTEIRVFNGWQIEEKDHATPWVPPGTTRNLSTVYDSSGYQNDGTITGNLSIASGSGRYDGCANLINSYITTKLYPFTETTISFWINRNSLTGTRQFIYTGWYGISIELTASNGWQVYYTYNSSGSTVSCSPSIVLQANTWYHCALVIGSSTGVKFYINGSQAASNTYQTPYYTASTVDIGNYSTYKNFNAKLSDFRVYSTALSAADIKDLYDVAAFIDNNKTSYGYELLEYSENLLLTESYGIASKTWAGGLSSYTQSHCQCTLTDTGYRIYRTPNLVYPDAGTVMWGGFVIDNGENNRYDLKQNHTYIIQFEIKGQTSNVVSDIYWANWVGWGGGGLSPSPSNVQINNPVTANYNSNEWKTFTYKWTISDSVYKTCTNGYGRYTTGETYMSYTGFKFGFGYTSTGSLGTDLYIRNLVMMDITNANNITVAEIFKTGVIRMNNFIEENTIPKITSKDIMISDNFIEI